MSFKTTTCIKTLKEFLKDYHYALIDEISLKGSSFLIPIKYRQSAVNSTERLYKFFTDFGFVVLAMDMHKRLPGKFNSPYAVIEVSLASPFFRQLFVGYSVANKCRFENGIFEGCQRLRYRIWDTARSNSDLYGMKVITKDFKYAGITLNGTSINYCPFCGQKVSVEEEASE